MLKSYVRLLRQVSRRLVVRVTLIASLALLAQLVAVLVGPFIPMAWLDYVGTDALDPIFTTLATASLAATTFAVSVMTSAHYNAANSATPRARLVLQSDHVTQSVLAAFIGAFLFSIIGLILRATPLMDEKASGVLFVFTGVVVVILLFALIRWIHHLESLGTVDGVLTALAEQAEDTMARHARRPNLGAHPWNPSAAPAPGSAKVLRADRSGYLQQILEDALQEIAEAEDLVLHLPLRPGVHVLPGRPLAHVSGNVSDACLERVRQGLLIRPANTLDQNPVFAVETVTEIGVRALSPGINDPQTAIAVIHRVGALLMASEGAAAPDVTRDRLHLAVLPQDALFRVSFDVLAREAKGCWEVQDSLRATLAALCDHAAPDTRDAARACLRRIGEAPMAR